MAQPIPIPIRTKTVNPPKAAPKVEPKISHLLDLPGGKLPTLPLHLPSPLTATKELRNRIYALALADILTSAILPGLAHPHRPAPTTRDLQMLTRNWRLFRRSCLGLTQT